MLFLFSFVIKAMVTRTLPVLEVDGVQLGQSIPIARFLARKYDLVGDNEMEMAQADMVIDCLHDQLNGRSIILLKYKIE